jgi:hypothetical protein
VSESDINKILWTIGWNLKATIGALFVLSLLLVFGAGDYASIALVSFLAIPLVPIVGLLHVNRNYQSVLHSFHDAVSQKADSLLDFEDDNVNYYSLKYGTGKKLLRKPHIKYTTATLVVADYSVTIHDGNSIRMPTFETNISNSTTEIYYDQIASVEYDEQAKKFHIQGVDGETTSWPCEREPDGVLSDLQQRVRDYKRQQVA